MLKRKLLTSTERLLNALPDFMLKAVSSLFFQCRRLLVSVYGKWPLTLSAVRFCDFILSRSHAYSFIEFELSNICNARCVFCPYPDMLKSGKKFMHMSALNLQRDMDMMRGFKPTLISFTPTTGDTLLHPDWDVYIRQVLELPVIKRSMMFTNAIELDAGNREKFFQLLESGHGYKLSQICFSLGGPDATSYKDLYRVDRFDDVCANIAAFTGALAGRGLFPGIFIQVKLAFEKDMSQAQAEKLLNPSGYPFIYYSFSKTYFSNEAFTRNALVEYRAGTFADQKKACAYLGKTRFAADGSVWADGCVISELPGDSALKLGDNTMGKNTLEKNRKMLITDWEKHGNIPLPCRGCTMYKPGGRF